MKRTNEEILNYKRIPIWTCWAEPYCAQSYGPECTDECENRRKAAEVLVTCIESGYSPSSPEGAQMKVDGLKAVLGPEYLRTIPWREHGGYPVSR